MTTGDPLLFVVECVIYTLMAALVPWTLVVLVAGMVAERDDVHTIRDIFK